jgi:hypothetical protein
MPDGNCPIYMESDFRNHDLKELLTGQVAHKIKNDQETTYISIEGPRGRFFVSGNLTYNQSWMGNNMKISLLGTITVTFTDIQGNDQVINIQLPDYILANYIAVEGKPRVSLISGSMVLEDLTNKLKSVIFIRGLIKKKTLF